jgi:hypothetical protein
MDVLNYFWILLVISPYATFDYFKLLLNILHYFSLGFFGYYNLFLVILNYS